MASVIKVDQIQSDTGTVNIASNLVMSSTVTRDGAAVQKLNRTTSDGDIVELQKDGTTVGSIGESSGLYIQRASGAGWQFGIGNISPRKSNALADNQIDLGSSSYRYKDLYLSGSVYLGGTGAANALDDYEEGTFTPEVADAITGGNTASGTFTGFYTKIGRVVTLNFNCTNIGTAGMTSGNSLHIRNLPFASILSTNLQSVNGTVYANALTLAAGEITMVFDVPDGESYGLLRTMISASNAGTITVGDITSGLTDLRIGITYTV